MSRGRSSFGASLGAFGLAALFAWTSSASAALSTTENTTGPVGSVDDRAPAAPSNVVAEANLVDFQGEISWDLSADDFLRQSPTGSDFTSGGTFVRTNDVAGYQIWRSALGGDYELIDTVAAGELSFIDATVESGVPYTYAVTAVDGAGNASASVESELVSFGPPGKAETKLPEDVPPVVEAVTMRFDSAIDVNDDAAVDEFIAVLIQLLVDLLGIDSSRIVDISVTAGSVIVNFAITDDPDLPANEVVALLDEAVEDADVFADAGLGSLLDYEASQATSIAFGEVEANSDGSTTLSFTNGSTEDDAILIVSSSVQGVGFFAFPTKLSLANGESGSIDVTFDAAEAGNVDGTYTGILRIITNDPGKPLMVISLSASVVGGLQGPVADVSSRAINFPRTTINSFATRDLIISNKGGLDLRFTISIDADDDVFSVSDEGTFTLASGESKTVEVVFAPVEAVGHQGTITVDTDDPAHRQFRIALSGFGVPEGGPPSLRDENGNEIFGDFDGDASVTFDDFFQFADNFSLTSASSIWDPAFDLNGDEQVNFDDFFIFADNFGKEGTYATT